MPPKRKTKQSVNGPKKDDGIHPPNEGTTTTKRMKKEMLDDQQDTMKETTAIKNEPEVDEVGDTKDVGKKRQRNSRKATSKRGNAKHVAKENDSEDTEDNSDGNVKDGTEEINNKKSRGQKRRNAKESKQAIVRDDVDDENEKKPQSKKKRTTKSTKSEEIDENYTPDVKTVIIKGKAPVDSFCIQKIGKAHVYCEGNDVWDAMLNQTNLQHNNNKYYVIQLLEDDSSKVYSVWFRWGRVGKKGQNSLVACGADVEKAKKVFSQKFQDKTKNSWDERASFQKVAGKYDLLHMDYDVKPDEEEKGDSKLKNEPIKIPKSALNERVQALIELICNVKAMEETVIEMKYDAKKAPLGKLTTNQIKAGYLALKEIEELIGNNTMGSKLVEACNKFYTRIPHDFGMRTPPLIRTREDFLLKMQLLETLGDIEIAIKMINEASKLTLENPVDRHYKCLNCALTAIDKESEMFKVINEYLQNSHEKTHNLYTMELVDVFECCKETEDDQFTSNDNRMLLWHGSRLTNWVGILKQGLRIAPPEAPVTGYMFGKGVYFADRSSKSANYCFATRSHNIGLMLLCEVALGNCNELFQANYNADKLPKGKQSVKGLGEIVPDPSKVHTMADGTIIPLGKGCQAKLKKSTALNYNEYVVYNTDQIKMRYLVKVKFHFK